MSSFELSFVPNAEQMFLSPLGIVVDNNTCSIPVEQQATVIASTGYLAGLKLTVLTSLGAAKDSIVGTYASTLTSISNLYATSTTAVASAAQTALTFAVENPVSVAVATRVSELASVQGVLLIGVSSVAAKKGIEWIQSSVDAAKEIKKSYRTAAKMETAKASAKVLGQAAVGAAVVAAAVAVVVM
jgi:hypothetical protein